MNPPSSGLITEPQPENILWVPRESLEQVRIGTGDIYDRRSEHRNADSFHYLTLWQQSMNGENKFLVTCHELGGIGAMAYFRPPDLAAGMVSHDLHALIAGVVKLPNDRNMISTHERWTLAVLSFTED